MTDVTGSNATISDNGKPGWPRMLLIVTAAIELLGSLAAVPLLFLNVPDMPGPPLSGTFITIRLLLQPLLALAALVLAIQNRMTFAIYALAVLIFVMWTSLLPTLAEQGLDLSGASAVNAIYALIVMPLIAGAAAALATGRQKLAVLLVALPTILDLISVIVFAISSAIFGD